MSRQMDERECVPAKGNFGDDDPDLRERGICQRRLYVALDACRCSRKQCCSRAEPAGEEPRRGCLFKQRCRAEQQKAASVNRQRAVIDGA